MRATRLAVQATVAIAVELPEVAHPKQLEVAAAIAVTRHREAVDRLVAHPVAAEALAAQGEARPLNFWTPCVGPTCLHACLHACPARSSADRRHLPHRPEEEEEAAAVAPRPGPVRTTGRRHLARLAPAFEPSPPPPAPPQAVRTTA